MLLQQAEVEMLKNDLTVPKLLYYLQPTIWVIDEIWTTLAELDMVSMLRIHLMDSSSDSMEHIEADEEEEQRLSRPVRFDFLD